jgi:predicted ATP-binding protein involved in virulence
MPNNIYQIKALIPNSNREASITLNNRNLIITGVNGCGKTQFINQLFDYLQMRIRQQNPYEGDLKSYILQLETQQKALTTKDAAYASNLSALNAYKRQLIELHDNPVKVDDFDKFTTDYHQKKAVLLKYDATRQANIRAATASRSLQGLQLESSSILETSNLFEEYLVSQKTAQAYAESPNIDNNPEEAVKIAAWFEKLESDLQELFEDKSLTLTFDSSSHSFFINQKNKSPYRFQQLSSGFSSILSIYADLLTKIQLSSTTPNQIYGVVFIDEIDAHLHVSLQRKILSFLTKSFPNIQYIVSTHSPFVVSSVNDAVIYDLSSLEQVEDLSMYSYESILSGLFNVTPVSEVLAGKILELDHLMDSSPIDLITLKTLTLEISEHENVLDSESAFFLKKAKILINKHRSKDA